MTVSAADLIRVAASQVGVHEGKKNGHWDNIQKYSEELPGFAWSDAQPWCDTYCGWCAWKAGLSEKEFPRSAAVSTSMAAWKGMGRWSEYPAIGAQVCFGNGAHTGIVESYDADNITTLEGNTNTSGSPEGDGVYRKTHARRDPWVTGYGYPIFSHPIQSADPAWKTDPAHPGHGPKLRHTKYVADYSFARPDPKALVAADIRGVMRYLSTDPSKNLTAGEAKTLHAAGLWVGLVWETTAGRATEGQAAGAADAIAAEAAADALGYPVDACIFYAVDSDVTAAKVAGYFEGVNTAARPHTTARRPVGIYGGFKVVDAGLAKFAWQTEAWSSGKVSAKADMIQRASGAKVAGTDLNELLRRRRWRVWKADTTPAPPPAPVPKPKPHHHTAVEVATLNVKSYPRMPIEFVDADLARAITEATLLGLQEIDPELTDYTAAVAALPGFDKAHLDTEDVIIWRTDTWKSSGGRKTMTHPGKHQVSPNRYVTEEDLELLSNGAEITVFDTHAVSKAFWSRKHGVKPTSYRWRRKMWKLHMQVMSQLIDEAVAKGRTSVIFGDFNHNGVPEFHPDQVTIEHGSLDGLAYVPATGGARIMVRSSEAIKDGWHTDHPMLRAKVKVSP